MNRQPSPQETAACPGYLLPPLAVVCVGAILMFFALDLENHCCPSSENQSLLTAEMRRQRSRCYLALTCFYTRSPILGRQDPGLGCRGRAGSEPGRHRDADRVLRRSAGAFPRRGDGTFPGHAVITLPPAMTPMPPLQTPCAAWITSGARWLQPKAMPAWHLPATMAASV